jgi:hypothetical protein
MAWKDYSDLDKAGFGMLYVFCIIASIFLIFACFVDVYEHEFLCYLCSKYRMCGDIDLGKWLVGVGCIGFVVLFLIFFTVMKVVEGDDDFPGP